MRIHKRIPSLILVIAMVAGYLPANVIEAKAEENTEVTENIEIAPLSTEIPIVEGVLDSSTGGDILESDIYGSIVNYQLKKGHTLSISDENYVFSVRKYADGNYATLLKEATTSSYTATEDMTVGMLIRKSDKSTVTAEELSSISIIDSRYGMIGVEGYEHAFTVEAETIDGGTATTRAAIFLPDSYEKTGDPTRLIIMTNGLHGHLTDSVWNANTTDDVGVMKHYMDNDYAVLVVNNTANKNGSTPDLGNPQLVSSYWKAYEYVQTHFNVEEMFSIHSRSQGTFAAVRLMREHPELVKCAVMCGAVLSIKSRFSNNPAFIAGRYGFDDTTGATWEADKVVGYDPYTDVDGLEYSLPPTFWMLAESDATTTHLSVIEKIQNHGNDVTKTIYSDTDHSGVCRLNIDACKTDSLAFLEKHQESTSEHRFYAWKVAEKSTCTEEGEMRRYCVDCDYYETIAIPHLNGHVFEEDENICTICGDKFELVKEEIIIQPGQFDNTTKAWIESDVYGYVIDYELKAGHTLSISDTDYVFAVRILQDGQYQTMVREASSDDYTTTEDVTVAIRVRKPDKSAITEEELQSLVLYDTSYEPDELEGKKLSILGASISTYTGISNNAESNATIGNNAVYYTEGRYGVYANDTWWMQAANDLGMELLVNNSWSGSSLLYERSGTVGAYVDRCVQLHNNDGDEPDVIAIQMGTNDFQYYKDTLGTADIDYTALIVENEDGSYTYAEPVTSLEAAAIVLHKISKRYPNAEVYYLNISRRIDGTDELIQSFNAELKQVVEYAGAHIVDIYGSAITMDDFATYIGDNRVHPNTLGMDAYTEAFKRAIVANTGYEVETHTVSMELDDVTADYGDDKIVVNGDGFSVNLTSSDTLDVTVLMGEEDITSEVYADGTVSIEQVTDDVTIYAKNTHIPQKYLWEFDGEELSAAVGENVLTKVGGTTTDGVFSGTCYSLDSAVVLQHDKPWAVEWKCEGTFQNEGSSSGARVFSEVGTNATYGVRYIFKSNKNGLIAMGEKTSTGSHNYGIALGDYDIDWTENHTYRLENRIAEDGSNMIYLSVDGTEIGAMNHYYVGTTDKGTTSDWLSGKDFVFQYMGTDTHGFTNASIEYISVDESVCSHVFVDGVCSKCGEQANELFDGFSSVDFFVKNGILSDGNEHVVAIYSNTNNARMAVIPLQDGATYYINVKNNDKEATKRMRIVTFAEDFSELVIAPLASEQNMSAIDSNTVSVAQEIVFWDPNKGEDCVGDYSGVFVNSNNAKTMVLFTAWGADPSLVEVSVTSIDHQIENEIETDDEMREMINILTKNIKQENTATQAVMQIACNFWEHRDEFIYCSGTALDQPWNYWSYTGYVDSSNTGKTITAENSGFKRIDCSTFVRYVINGIDYYSTPYYNMLELTEVEQGGLENGVDASKDDNTICRTGKMYIRTGKKLILETKNTSYSFTKIYGYDVSGNVIQTLEEPSRNTVFVPADGVVYLRAEMKVTAIDDYAPASSGTPAAILKCMRIRESEQLEINAECPLSGYRNANQMCQWFDENGYAVEYNLDSFNVEDLRVGTVIFWGRNTGTWAYKNITHTSIYIGDGYVLHVSAPNGLIGGKGILIEHIDVLMDRYDIPLAGISSPAYHMTADDHMHDYQTSVTNPTCTEQGYTTHTCATCSDSFVDGYVEAIGHNYADGVCANCGESLVEWEQGTIASASGLDNTTVSRFRTVGYLRLNDFNGVSISEGYTMTNFVYDEAFNYLGTSSWLGSGMPFTTAELQEQYPSGIYFRVVFRANDQRTLYEEDITASEVKFYLPDEEVPMPDCRFTYEDIGTVGSWQDGAIWDGKLFTLNASGSGAVYDVETAEKIAGFTLDSKEVIKPHANSVCFGNTYYEEGDKYPLLYVNVYNNYASEEDRMEGTCCVYRIIENEGAFSTELVQMIRIGFTEDLTLWKSIENNGDVRPYGNFVVDTDEDKLYAFVMRDAEKTTRFFGFDIPKLDEGTYVETYGCNQVVLEVENIKTQFDTEYFRYLQGCCYSSGMILSMEDFGGETPLKIVDLETQTVIDTYYLGYAGLTSEPEVLCVDPDEGVLYYAAADGVLRKITLDDVHFHNYSAMVTKPACTTQGYTTYTCACGDSYKTPWLDSSAYEGMTIACIGDSITAGVGVTTDETDYVYLLSRILGMDFIRLGASGTVLCTDGHRTCNINKLTESKLAGADVVTILMGVNDFDQAQEGYYTLGDIDSTDTSTIYGAVRMWCEQIVELRKTESLADTQFYFITPVITSWNHSVSTSKCWEQSKTNIHGYTLRDLCNVIIEVCALYDIAVIDLNLISGMYYNSEEDNNITEFGGDGVHPGTVGHEMMAEAIGKALLQNNQRTDHEHTYGSWITTTYAGCENGEQKRVCSICTAIQSRMLEGGGHTYGDWTVTKESTCTEGGTESRSCTVCKVSETKTIEKLGHHYKTEITAPTCAEQGYTTHTCTRCSDSFVDGYAAAVGHSYGDWITTKEATCTADGSAKRSCKNCNAYETKVVTKLGHSYTVITTNPTCTEQGYDAHTCERCGDSYIDNYVDAAGHKYGAWTVTKESTCTEGGTESRSCTVCKVSETKTIEKLGHHYKTEITAPTCAEQGYKTHTCTRCSDSFVDGYAAAVGHSYGDWITTKEATCTADGSAKRTCQNCDAYEIKVVTKLGHKYTVITTNPTCTEKGYDTHTCERCEDSYKDNYVDATGHKYGAWTVTKGSTCTAGGTEKRSCTVCKASETRTIEKLGHNYKTVVTAPTCTEEGYTTHICTRCSESFVDTKVSTTDHSYGSWVTTKEASCTLDGSAKRTCQNCDAYETKVVTKLGHKYTVITINPTCTEKGYDIHTCERCEDSYKDNYEDAAGHSYGSWATTKVATCTADGSAKRTCTNCDAYETKILTKLNHDYASVVTKPTCTAKGYTTHTCTRCSDNYVDTYTAAKGHNYSSWQTAKKASCTEEGVKTRRCLTCKITESKTIAELNHDYVSVVTKPTCTSKGYTTHTCIRCKDTYKDNYVAKLAHSWEKDVTIDRAATAEKSGSMSVHCADCSAKKAVTAIPKIEKVSCVKKRLYTGKVLNPSITVKDANGNKLVLGTDYAFVVYNSKNAIVKSPKNIGEYQVKITFKGKYSGTETLVYQIVPKTPEKLTLSLKAHDDIKVTWSGAKEATGYYVYYKQSAAATYKLHTITSSTTTVIKDLKDNVKYDVKIVPYGQSNGMKIKSKNAIVKTIRTLRDLAAPKTVTLKLTGHDDIKVTWSKVANAKGYYVYYKKSVDSKYKSYKVTTETSLVLKNLADDTKYNIKIVPYGVRNSVKVTSDQYKVKSIRTLENLKAPAKLQLKATGKTVIKASWSKVSDAKGYYVYYKVAGANGYKLYKTTTGTSITITGLKKNTKYSVKVVPYGISNSLKVKSDNYVVKNMTTLKK